MKIGGTTRFFITVVITLVVVIIGIILIKGIELKEYSRDYEYMDTYINVKLYAKNERKANKAFDEVDKIFSTYHKLTNRYEDSEYGLYRLNKEGDAIIDYRLYQIIEYGYLWYNKSHGLLNIAIGNLTDVWKKYRDQGSGIPTKEELENAYINFDELDIIQTRSEIYDKKLEGSVTLSEGITLDLGSIAKGYVTDLVGEYLESVGIKSYIINAGGNVLVGKAYKKDYYTIGIESPLEEQIYKVLKGENVAVVTSGGYRRNYTYEGKTYNHIIDPNTKYPADNVLSVTVITDESKEADALATTLFLMSYEEGSEFIKDYNAEAIWYLKDGTIKTTDYISEYE